MYFNGCIHTFSPEDKCDTFYTESDLWFSVKQKCMRQNTFMTAIQQQKKKLKNDKGLKLSN